MYSAKKIQATLDAFEKSEGWMPTPHTLDEINEFKEELSSKFEIHSNSKGSWIERVEPLSEKRQKEIAKWIQNEQVMCGLDSGYFESRYVYVRDECGNIKKFQNRKTQDVLDSVIGYLDDRGFGIELLISGSRQSGIGTKIILKMIHKALFSPNTNVALATNNNEKSYYTKVLVDTVYDNLPWWLIPIRTSKETLSNGSRIAYYSGMQTARLAQGFTPQYIYVSNVESYPSPHIVLEENILQAVHSSRNTFLVYHGQKGNGIGWFNDLYRYSKKYWSEGKSRFLPIFIPWVMSTDIYPVPDWLRAHPIPKEWKPLEETATHANRVASFIRNTPYLAKIAGVSYCVPLEQQWFWEYEYIQAKERKALDSFLYRFSPDDGETDEEYTDCRSLSEEGYPIQTEEIDMENLDSIFPQPDQVQKKVAAIRQGLLEGQ